MNNDLSFKEKLMYLAIKDKLFYLHIKDIFISDAFELEQEKYLVKKINELYKQYSNITLKMIEDKLNIESQVLSGPSKMLAKMSIDIFNKISFYDQNYIFTPDEIEFLKNESMLYLRKQYLKNKLKHIVDNKEIDNDYDKSEKSILEVLAKNRYVLDDNIGTLFGKDIRVTKRENIVPCFDEFNEITDGGIAGGELAFVMGGPSIGKSHFLVNVGVKAALNGKNVFHYTLELSETSIVARYDAILMERKINEITNMSIEEKEKLYEHMRNKYPNLGQIVVKSFGTGIATVLDIRAHIDKCINILGIKPDIIIVDYDELLQTDNTDQFRFALRKIYISLRQLACGYGCPVWTASQVNRSAIRKQVTDMEDLAEDFSKIKTADFAISLARPEENSRVIIKNVKNRIGPDKYVWQGEIDTSMSKFTILDRMNMNKIDKKTLQEISEIFKEN